LAAALFALAVPAGRVVAQSQTDVKIRLMSETLRARDAGDLDTAQKTLNQLIALSPNDPSVQRLRSELEALRAAKVAAASAPAPAAPAPAAPAPAAPAMIDVKIPEPGQVAPSAGRAPTPEEEAEALARAESARITAAVSAAQTQLSAARSQLRAGQPDNALATLDAALASLPSNPLTQKIIADLKKEKASALLDQAQARLKAGDTAGARASLAAQHELAPADSRATAIAQRITRAEAKTAPVPGVDAQFLADRAATAELVAKGRAQYVAGDIDGAQATFRAIEAQEPDNAVAKGFLLRIAQEKTETGALNREKTRAQLLEEVAKGWQRPGIYQERARDTDKAAAAAPLAKKLTDIILPSVSFTRAEIGQVVTALGAASEEFDTSGAVAKGVNIVLLDPSNKNPTVTLTLRNASLKRALDFVTESVGYQYEVQADAVIVRPGGETSTLDTAFFPITRATVLRMTGLTGSSNAKADPFASGGAAGEAPTGGEVGSMKSFLQQAGVNFESVPGSSLAYDGSAIIVTQTARNVERIRNILARYNDVRQVEIESKFMEVQEGALEELGVNWNLSRRGIPQVNPTTGAPVLDSSGRQVFTPQEVYSSSGVNRPLSDAFSAANNIKSINVNGGVTTTTTSSSTAVTTATTSSDSLSVPVSAPTIPGAVSLASGASALARITGFVGEFDVTASIRALSQKQGSDLLSSPKVTFLSGNPANIVVAQELRYPQSYGEIQSQAQTGSVSITSGTPQEFTSRNVGVEMKVTPTVEEDDYSISLDLNPKVTEFEGFVEYGGPSVAIAGATTVTVPPGFYQPIFSVR
ncbi:MAG: type II secretory pathway, component PulD, partial [Verrucomicrobia bacterium]|nr:type II secretory pathway, component PulD [Verrucomicrobiota bacterium]